MYVKLKIPNPVQSWTYIVFKGDDGRIYAKSGDTGEIVASDDKDLGVVLQSIINQFPDFKGSQTIYIKPGLYKMYTGVRSDRNFSLIGDTRIWDWVGPYGGIKYPTAYPGVFIRLMTDGIRYFDLGPENPNDPSDFAQYAIANIGASASDENLVNVQHQSSIFIYLRNRVRHSLFDRIFIVGVGKGIVSEVTVSGSAGLQDVYFYRISVEHPYINAFEIRNGSYNIRLVDVYVGWNKTDTNIISIQNAFAVYVDRLWILGGTYRALNINNCSRVIVRDVIIESLKGSNGFALQYINDGVVDTVLLNYDGTNSPAYIFYLNNNGNLEIRNVYAKYKNNTIYLIGSMPRMRNVRLFNVNNNIEYRSENSGVATISAGSTRVTVTHNLIATPTKVLVTPLGNARVWVENITSTSFDIVTDAAPAADLQVSWYAEI